MAKKRKQPTLTPIQDYVPAEAIRSPKPESERQTDLSRSDAPQSPDLSYIIEDLRSCAVPIGEVEFLPKNPRLHQEKDLALLAANVEKWGQYRPVVVNIAKTPHQVVAGNGVLSVMLAAGRSHIARVRKDLTDEEAALLAIADNETALQSRWDPAALSESLAVAKSLKVDRRLAEMMEGLEKGKSEGDGAAGEKSAIETPDTSPPPAIVWVLLGIPLDSFAECQEHLAALEGVADVSVQSNRDR